MLAFEIHLNGKRLCSAGIGEDGVLTSLLTWVKRSGTENEHCQLEIAGLISAIQEQVEWTVHPVAVGDEIRIKIMDTEIVDEPISRKRTDAAADLERQKKYVRHMAERFGWTIQTT